MEACSRNTLKRLNTRALLRLVLERKSLPQRELIRLSGLKKATVSLLAGGLKKKGWLYESGLEAASSKGGPRPRALSLCKQAITALGFSLRDNILRAGWYDLDGKALAHETFRVKQDRLESWQSRIISQTLAFRKRAAAGKRHFLGAGLALGCVYDPARDTLVGISGCPEKAVSIEQTFNRHLGTVRLATDDFPNALAVGEMWFGRAARADNFLYVQLRHPRVTAVVGRRLYRGSGLMAGEVGPGTVEGVHAKAFFRQKNFSRDPRFNKWVNNLICLYDPQKIFFSLEDAPAGFERIIPRLKARARCSMGSFGQKDVPRAAATLVFDRFFNEYQLN